MFMLENGAAAGKVRLDHDGCLERFEDWNESVAAVLAQREGLAELSDVQIAELRFIREQYQRYNFFPIPAAVCKAVGGPKDCLDRDFGNPLIAWKLAGLPHPEEPVVSLLEAGQSPG
jgi:sulfur relay (sulfurtransferase) DsrC/TusE family protein